ncbi:MAG: response regulator, partial [Desulfovibrio sp.]|nr:response regulator [Desulfovibrio sp.]
FGKLGQSYSWNEVFPIYVGNNVLESDADRCLVEFSMRRISDRLQREQTYNLTYQQKIKGQEVRTMLMNFVPVKPKQGSEVIIGVRDVTAWVSEIQEECVKQRGENEKLDLLKRANEAKNTFLFNISHDIRTPMNSIMGFTELARKHVHEPNLLVEYLGKVDIANRHMLALIDDLLEMSQLDSGRTMVKLEVCNLKEHVLAVLGMVEQDCAAKRQHLLSELDLPEKDVWLDPLCFRRVLTNLLSNAVKFTPVEGTITLKARATNISKSGYARYEVVVADNGVGMSEEFLSRIFNVFEREGTSTQTGSLGTGLGLAITKRLLNIMGGSIRVESVKGQGSTFTVNLPLKFATEAESEINVVKASSEELEGVPLQGKRILLVEDIEINRLLAETVLTEAGFEVESVPDGCDAVAAVEKSPFFYYDLVLMDIQMPVMNGYEATRVIRGLGRPDTAIMPIIALSANARQEDRDMSLESGMNSHIAKPFDLDHLLATIRSHMHNEEQARAAEADKD